jgi:hypothetical protein
MAKRGVSAAEKRIRMLDLFYETQEFYQLKVKSRNLAEAVVQWIEHWILLHIGASAARPLTTIENTIVARGFAAEAPI